MCGYRWKRCGFYPWVRKIPWSGKWQPIPVFLPGKFHGQKSLVGCGPGVARSWTQLSTHTNLCLWFYMSLTSQLFYIYFTSSLAVFSSLHFFIVVVETSIFPSLPPALVLKWWSLDSLRTFPSLQIESVLCRNTCRGQDWFRGAQLIHDHLDHVELKKIRWMEQGTLVRWSAYSTRLRAAERFLLLHQFIIKWLMHLGALGFMETVPQGGKNVSLGLICHLNEKRVCEVLRAWPGHHESLIALAPRNLILVQNKKQM